MSYMRFFESEGRIKPEELKLISERVESENYKFRRYLKGRANPEKLDKYFLDLHNELFEGYDCASCRNCCKELSATITPEEVEQIAACMHMPKEDFIRRYTEETPDGYEVRDKPCAFLNSDYSCQLENCKPQSCIDYPHTNKPDRLFSLLGIMDSTTVCPVAFEIVERLKKMYRFR